MTVLHNIKLVTIVMVAIARIAFVALTQIGAYE